MKALLVVNKEGQVVRLPVVLKSAKKEHERTANYMEDIMIERIDAYEKAKQTRVPNRA